MKQRATRRNGLLGRLFGSKTTYRRTRTPGGGQSRRTAATESPRAAREREAERLHKKFSDAQLDRKLKEHYAQGGSLREFMAMNPPKGGVYTVSMKQGVAIPSAYGLYAHLTTARRLAGKEGAAFIAEVVDSQRKKVGYLVPRAGFGVNELREVVERYPGLSKNPARKGSLGYAGPDSIAHVFSFAHTVEEAQKIADEANRSGTTRRGKFTAGSFTVAHIPGRLPAVVGRMTGNPGSRKQKSAAYEAGRRALAAAAARLGTTNLSPSTVQREEWGHAWREFMAGWNAERKVKNPASAAAEVYEEFHGTPSTSVLEVRDRVHTHEHLAELGRLELLVVNGIDGYEHRISGFKGARLCSNETKDQLFIRGGDQKVGLGDYGIKPPHEVETLGQVTEIQYFTTKTHLGSEGGTAIYFHKAGTTSENGRHKKVGYGPDLIYRVRDKALEFSGGTYEIRAEGIDK
jgi:hypothetical protein